MSFNLLRNEGLVLGFVFGAERSAEGLHLPSLNAKDGPGRDTGHKEENQ